MPITLKDKDMQWWMKSFLFFSLFIFISVFTFLKMNFLVEGVQIVAQVKDNGDSSLVEVTGKASGATHVTLNGREIFIDKDGSFKEKLVLLPGLSILKLNTEDAFGKSSEKKFELVYKEPDRAVAFNSH